MVGKEEKVGIGSQLWIGQGDKETCLGLVKKVIDKDLEYNVVHLDRPLQKNPDEPKAFQRQWTQIHGCNFDLTKSAPMGKD